MKGAIGVIELDHDVDVAAATAVAVEHGVWLRPFRDLVYAMPPYVTDDEDLARITEAMVRMRVVVTGTDTGVGKTFVSAALVRRPRRPTSSRPRPATTTTRRPCARSPAPTVHTLARYPEPLSPERSAARAGVPCITPREIADFVEHAATTASSSRAPAACSCASATAGRSPTSRSCSTRR